MKIKTTQKQIKENYNNILSLGYCKGERLFNYFEPTFYISGSNGWICDIYTFRKGYKCFAVSSGYGYLTYDEKKSEYKATKIDKTLKKVYALEQRFKALEKLGKLGRFKDYEKQLVLIQNIIIRAFWQIIEK